MKNQRLNQRQEQFCREYVTDLNATRAYKAVYKNVKSDDAARSAAARTLSKVYIRNFVEALKAKTGKKLEITAEKVLRDIEEARLLALSMNKTGDAIKASELQGKYLGMWKEKVELEGAAGLGVIALPQKKEPGAPVTYAGLEIPDNGNGNGKGNGKEVH